MDESNESSPIYDQTSYCFWQKTTIDCDERFCSYAMWSCGDGQCIAWTNRLVFQNLVLMNSGCLNMRHRNHMCELTAMQDGWTLPTGLCWFFTNSRYDDPRLSMNNPALSDEEKCIYLIRCLLSNGSERDCPCNRFNCSSIIPSVCEKTTTHHAYPNGALIRPYIRTYYNWRKNFTNKIPHKIHLTGNIRCSGYHGFFDPIANLQLKLSIAMVTSSKWDSLICPDSKIIRNKTSSRKYDDHCWKDSLTFNGYPYAFHNVCVDGHRYASRSIESTMDGSTVS